MNSKGKKVGSKIDYIIRNIWVKVDTKTSRFCGIIKPNLLNSLRYKINREVRDNVSYKLMKFRKISMD